MKKALSIAALLVTAIAGTAFAADHYDLSIKAPAAKAKEKATATVTVKAKGAMHVNVDYPTKLTLTAPEGVKLEKEKILGKEAAKFDKEELKFDVAFTTDSAGKKTINGELKFAVCDANTCNPKTEKISIEVEAK